MIRYARVLAFVNDHYWAILRSTLDTIAGVVSARSAGLVVDREQVEERLAIARAAAGPRAGAARGGGGMIAVIPMYGIICQRASLMSDMSGGCSLDKFGAAFDEAVGSADVAGIVIDVDSPGGTIDGVTEVAARMRAARGSKPIVAVADTMMASAAYWLACQADEVVVTPSGFVGSIGVFGVHTEYSKSDEMLGITTTIIRAGRYKNEMNDSEPLTDAARQHAQSDVDYIYGLFVNDVAKGRGVSAQAVTAGYGEGRALPAQEAVAAGLADRLGTLEDAIMRCASGKVGRGARAEASGIQMVAVELPEGVEGDLIETATREDAPGIAAQMEAQRLEAEAVLAAAPDPLDFIRARSRAHRI